MTECSSRGAVWPLPFLHLPDGSGFAQGGKVALRPRPEVVGGLEKPLIARTADGLATCRFRALEDVRLRHHEHLAVSHERLTGDKDVRHVAGVAVEHQLMNRHEPRHQMRRSHLDRRNVGELSDLERPEVRFAADRAGGVDRDHRKEFAGGQNEGIVRRRLLQKRGISRGAEEIKRHGGRGPVGRDGHVGAEFDEFGNGTPHLQLMPGGRRRDVRLRFGEDHRLPEGNALAVLHVHVKITVSV